MGAWTVFRDTFEVNGTLRRSRDELRRNLFLEQSEDSRLLYGSSSTVPSPPHHI